MMNVEGFCGACARPLADSIVNAAIVAARTARTVFMGYSPIINHESPIACSRILFKLAQAATARSTINRYAYCRSFVREDQSGPGNRRVARGRLSCALHRLPNAGSL